MTCVDCPQVWPLVVVSIPLLCAPLHLCRIVGSQGQMLQTTTSRNRTSQDKAVQRESIQGAERASWTLHSLIDNFGQRIRHIRIVMSGSRVLDIVVRLEVFETLCASIVDVLGIGNKLRRRRSVGGRHFEWRTGGWFKRQRLMLLLSAYDRHALLWSPLPLPRDSFVHRPDKPRIFFIHSDPRPFGVWCYFYLHLTHLCSIFVTPLSSNPPLSPITPL